MAWFISFLFSGKLYARISVLENDLTQLTSHRAAQEAEIANIENLALKQRFLSKLADIETQIREKEYEVSLTQWWLGQFSSLMLCIDNHLPS